MKPFRVFMRSGFCCVSGKWGNLCEENEKISQSTSQFLAYISDDRYTICDRAGCRERKEVIDRAAAFAAPSERISVNRVRDSLSKKKTMF